MKGPHGSRLVRPLPIFLREAARDSQGGEPPFMEDFTEPAAPAALAPDPNRIGPRNGATAPPDAARLGANTLRRHAGN